MMGDMADMVNDYTPGIWVGAILTPADVDLYRRIGTNIHSAMVSLEDMDALCASHEALRAQRNAHRETLRLIGAIPRAGDAHAVGIDVERILRKREPQLFGGPDA